MKRALFCLPLIVLLLVPAAAATSPLIEEHVYGGMPSDGVVLERHAYVMEYDYGRKAPRWVAYRLIPEYRNTPRREGQWETYRADPTVNGEPRESDYAGVNADPIRNYARGHIAPYFICGGDRNGNGILADHNDNLQPDDFHDAATVYQINYHSNLTPQHHNAFNGAGGVWFKIETRIRNVLLPQHGELWVFGGPIFGPGTYDVIGESVHVAPMFFQIVIWEDDDGTPQFEAYLLPHHQKPTGDPEHYLVAVRHIEAMTGLNFFRNLELGDRKRISTAP